MKIELPKGSVHFSELSIGDIFLLDGKVGMKIKVPSNPQTEGLDLSTGISWQISRNELVTKVDGTLKVRGPQDARG